MNRACACVIAGIVVISTFAAATNVYAALEHARLTAMVGTWDVEMTFLFQPGRPGVTVKATSTIRPLFGGLFVEEKIEGVPLRVVFENGAEVDVTDLQVFPSTKAVSFKTRQPTTVR